MLFDAAEGAWSFLEGPAEDYALGETRRRILVHLRAAGPATPKAIAEALGIDHENAKKTCQRMSDDAQLGTDGSGAYNPLSPASPLSPEGLEGHQGQERVRLSHPSSARESWRSRRTSI